VSTQPPTTPPAPSHPLNADRPPLWPYLSVGINLVLIGVIFFAPPDTNDPRYVTGSIVTRALNTEDAEQHEAIVTAVIDHIISNGEVIVTAVMIDPLQANCPPNFSDYIQPEALLPFNGTTALPDAIATEDVYWSDYPEPGWHTINREERSMTEFDDGLTFDELPPDAVLEPPDADDPGCPDEEDFTAGSTDGNLLMSHSRRVMGPEP